MQNKKLVLIVVDALRFDTACSHMGFLHHLVERKVAARYKICSEVPALSRPLYETILTGTPPHRSWCHKQYDRPFIDSKKCLSCCEGTRIDYCSLSLLLGKRTL